jgi:cell pole-organizing protein PopZ
MPGLLRGIARTAVVAGTASAVSGRVRRHQDRNFAEKDARAADQQAYDDDDGGDQQIPDQRSAPEGPSMLDQLKQLGELKESGVLTEQEFADQKAKILAGG